MTWHQSSARLLTMLIDGEPSAWHIMKFGLEEPYHFELWHGTRFHGRFDSARAATEHQQRIAQ